MRPTILWRRTAFALGILVATSTLVAACGGGSGDGSDEDYVKAICESNDILEEVIGEAMAAAFSGDDPDEDSLDGIVSAFEEWVEAIDDANPPADAADAHNALVDSLKDAVDDLKNGDADLDTMFGDDDTPEPPQAVQDRLNEVAAGVEACDGTDLF